jgi:sugar lactone lactonase YvrE/phage shock protein PspC (stress-responsive transcriptional regulator)
MGRLMSLPFSLVLLLSPLEAVVAQPPAGQVLAFGPNLTTACPLPEGLTVDPVGNFYVASVESAPQGAICVIDAGGHLTSRLQIARAPDASNSALTGLAFSPGRGLYALDVGDFLAGGRTSQNGRLLRIDPATKAVATVAGGFALPNGVAEDNKHNIYVSDSARGTIYRVAPGGDKSVWSQDGLLSHHVNDLAFDAGFRFLYAVTTGAIVRIPLRSDGTAGAGQIFADPSTSDQPNFASGLFSDDGIALDGLGNVFMTAAATSEIFELSPAGKLISRFSGSGPNVLDEPSALVFSKQNLYISNTSGSDGGLHAGLAVLRALPQTRATPGFLIHGQVTDAATHADVQGITVTAVDANIACCPFHTLSFAPTDSSGSYSLLVPSGSSVKIEFAAFGPNAATYLDQWWNNKSDFNSADTLDINAETFNINAALVRAVRVHGQVTDATTHVGIQGINVNAVDPAVNCCPFHNFSFAQTDASGDYEILVPAGGPVKLQFFSFGPNQLPYIDQWWNNKPDFDAADTLNVTVETFHIDAALARGVFVHGQVTDASSHAAIEGINVLANHPDVCCMGISFAQTDASGNYRILVPASSPVKLQFATFGPDALPYFEQWWNHKPDFDTADSLTVSVETFNIDASLVRGVFVHGHATDSGSHAALANINVNAVDPAVSCCPFHNLAFAQTDSSGAYKILAPIGRPVKIQFFSFGPDAPPYFEQWWNNKPDFDTADSLTASVETFNIDAALVRGVFVHGHVTDAVTHSALAGISVTLVDPTVSCCPFHNLSFAQTDSSGDYAILAPISSPAKVQFGSFGPSALPYFEQWWNNKPDFGTADLLTVSAETFNIDAALVRGVLVAGKVTDASTGAAIQGIIVSAVEPTAQFHNLAFGSSDADGNYQMVLHAGDGIKVQFSAYGPGSPPYVPIWWDNKADFNNANTLVVNGDTFNINAAMARGGVITGHVTDSVTHLPVAGVGVEMNGAIADCCGAATDADGNYQFVAPFGSSVKISFASFDAGQAQAYLTQWWNHKPSFDTADVLLVDGDKSGIDAALVPGFWVHGQVTDAATHLPIGGIFVQGFAAGSLCCTQLAFAITDPGGNYRIAVPQGGAIKVQFASPIGGPPYVEQWWNGKAGFDSADTLTVNQETFGINAALTPG